MARKLEDLNFELASCCGTHLTARFTAQDGAEVYVKHDTETDLYSVMRMQSGLLAGPLQRGLTSSQVEQLLADA